MIWFFLAGFISGVAGMLLFARWWVRNNIIPVSKEEMLRDLGEDPDEDGSDH